MTAILFGSISTLADTSELQRQAFNDAFAAHDLDWQWDQEDYAALLDTSGGQDRIADHARSAGQTVDAAAVHQTKSERFQQLLTEQPIAARPGVADAVRQARDGGLRVGLITTTSPDNVAALLDALSPDLGRDDFDLVVDASDVAAAKPDPAAYAFALDRLGEASDSCVAIEDNVGGVQAAKAAALACVAFPNENTAGHDFAASDRQVQAIDLAELRQLVERD